MFKCVLISLLEIKSFVSLKNESSLFWMRAYFKAPPLGGVNFEEGLLIKGGESGRFRIF